MEVMIMNDEEIDNLIHQMIFGIPKDDNKNIISAYEGIDMDDLTATIRRLKKVPDINDLMKENKRLTNNWNELEEWLKSYIALIENPDTLEEQTLEDLKEVLDKMNEIKEGNNVSSRD